MNYKVYITKTAEHDLIEVMDYIEYSLSLNKVNKSLNQ